VTDLPNDSIKLKIEPAEDEDDEELENSIQILVKELNQIDGINEVSLVTKKVNIPEGAKTGEVVSLGEIILSFITSGALVASLNFLSGWLKSRKRKMRIETRNGTIETDNLSKEEFDKVMDLLKEK
jgi:hypothetical protein